MFDLLIKPLAASPWLTKATQLAFALLFSFVPPSSFAQNQLQQRESYSERADIRGFVAEMVAKHSFDENELLKVFSQVRYSDDALRLIAPAPVTAKRSWKVYRTRFLDQFRINEGVKFWRLHKATAERAAAQYGVPEDIIMSIIGVETIYGRNTGNFRVIDALTTIGFNYPRRAEFFKGELESFLVLARANKFDPFSVLGSYAGAIGLPQFMPSSILRYAKDFDDDGVIDLRGNPVDAIGSVARFLAEHGWQAGKQATYTLRLDEGAKLDELIAAGIEPKFTASQLAERGVRAEAALPAEELVALIDLPNGDDPTFFQLGARNFYVITRYNRSSFYAQAVLDLASALKQAMLVPAAKSIQAPKSKNKSARSKQA